MVASAPGSTENIRPVLCSAFASCSRVTPASTVASRSSDADAQDPVHLAQIDRDAAVQRVDVALERGAGAERHDRARRRGADRDDRLDFFGRVRQADDVGSGGGVIRLAMAVMLAHRFGVARAPAQQLLELHDRRLDRRGGGGREITQSITRWPDYSIAQFTNVRCMRCRNAASKSTPSPRSRSRFDDRCAARLVEQAARRERARGVRELRLCAVQAAEPRLQRLQRRQGRRARRVLLGPVQIAGLRARRRALRPARSARRAEPATGRARARIRARAPDRARRPSRARRASAPGSCRRKQRPPMTATV